MIDNAVCERFPLKVVPLSGNAKIGSMAATYRPVGDTCPQDCMFLNHGCYAQRGNTAIHMRRSATDYHDLDRALAKGMRIIRHHVSGDFFKDDSLDTEYFNYVMDWHRAHPKVQGYAYTHRIMDIISAGITADTLPDNFALMASLNESQLNNSDLLDAIKAAGFRYTRVVKGEDNALTSKDTSEVVCPQQLAKSRHNSVTCTDCKICVHGKTNVVFIKH